MHTIQTWHEQYGVLTRMVDVKAGQTATVDVAYNGKEKPAATGVLDLVILGGVQRVTLTAER